MAVQDQVGFKSETTWGVGVTVDTFHPGWLSGNPTRDQPPLMSKGMRSGRRTSHCLSTGGKNVAGSISTELFPAPLATLLRHMFGTVNTTGAGPYVHTASPGPLNGKSFTWQTGIQGTAGTVHPFTAVGCKIPSWTLKAEVDALAMLDFDISAKDLTTATALATASYGSACPFTFIHGSVSIAGSTIATVKSFELSSTRPMRTDSDGRYIGSALISEQLETGQAEYEVTVETEFENLTVHDLANSGVAVVLTLNNGTETFVVTMNCWVNATTPTVEGVDSLSSFTFTGTPYGATDAAAITAVLTNSESSAA